MATTYTLISSVTVGSGGASSIAFTSIPATYTDLVILTSLRTNTSGDSWDGIRMTFNNATANRSNQRVYGSGSGVGRGTGTSMFGSVAGTALNTSNVFGNGWTYISRYASSYNKASFSDGVNENNNTTALAYIGANLWADSAAISSIQLDSENSGNFIQYSTAYLYGISNA